MEPSDKELQRWAMPQLAELLPLNEEELKSVISYVQSLSDSETEQHLQGLIGDSPEANQFSAQFIDRRNYFRGSARKEMSDEQDSKSPGPLGGISGDDTNSVITTSTDKNKANGPPAYAPPQGPPPVNGGQVAASRYHTNPVIEAGKLRARDEQNMQNWLQQLQYSYGIYNDDVEPEHDTEYNWCTCAIHQYKRRKYERLPVQNQWSKAVMYPGEKAYHNAYLYNTNGYNLFSSNPYLNRVISPYGYQQSANWAWNYQQRPISRYHAQSVHQTIDLNNSLNREAQAAIDAKEPQHNIWEEDSLQESLEKLHLGDKKRASIVATNITYPSDKKRDSVIDSGNSPSKDTAGPSERPKASKFSSFRKSMGIKSSEERAVGKIQKGMTKWTGLRDDILAEENGRWPDESWRELVMNYQAKVGMTNKIAELRAKQPMQYLHLLRAGYFEPIPVAWASQNSNPLKFKIDAQEGWRGITPAWRGYDDTAEERLYWVLNHRVGSVGSRLKPDFISALNMARERMARAVEPPPMYYSETDTCHRQGTSAGYSKQVLPPPFQAYDRPEQATDDTMILLDVSGSMDFQPQRPVYDQYLVTGWTKSTQPKNRAVAKAIINRFVDAMSNHDHQFQGYDLVTFSGQSNYIGTVNHRNLDYMWRNVRFGGTTRVMTGWQKVKEIHFNKNAGTATHHPVFGWQAGPETPMLRLLLLLDGEAIDMDEFELDLLGLSWAHVTIFLIGVDGCPHHHRHANELQRISDVNHHVTFVDAQGNFPERFVTHELLKRHLGYDMTLQEFGGIEELPPYSQ